jgi:hypothetical protein
MLVNNFTRIALTSAATCALLAPGYLVFVSWGIRLNLVFSLCAIVACAVGIRLWRGAKLYLIAFTALIISIPPYPYWVLWDNNGHFEFHFFLGFSPKDIPYVMFAAMYAIAIISLHVLDIAFKPTGRIDE